MDWYPKYPTEYRNDTWGLSLAAHGAYNLMIDYYYQNEAPIPDDDRAIASIIGAPLKEWLEIKDEVLPHFKKRGGKLHHNKCRKVLETSYKKRKDGTGRQKRHRKLLENNNPVTHDKHVSNAPRGEERIVEDKKEEVSKSISVLRNTDICGSGIIGLEAVDLWNLMAEKTKLPKVQMLTAVRKKKLHARLAEIGGLPGWRQALVMVAESKFLVGDNDSGWTASFDFLLQPSSMTKLMEGNYRNREGHNPHDDPNSPAAVERLRAKIIKEKASVH